MGFLTDWVEYNIKEGCSRGNMNKFIEKMKWGGIMGNERNIRRNWKNYDVLDNVDKLIKLWIKVVKENEWKWGEMKDRKGKKIKKIR